jgi:hypothetical protein
VDILWYYKENNKAEQDCQGALDDKEIEPLMVICMQLEDAIGDKPAKCG